MADVHAWGWCRHCVARRGGWPTERKGRQQHRWDETLRLNCCLSVCDTNIRHCLLQRAPCNNVKLRFEKDQTGKAPPSLALDQLLCKVDPGGLLGEDSVFPLQPCALRQHDDFLRTFWVSPTHHYAASTGRDPDCASGLQEPASSIVAAARASVGISSSSEFPLSELNPHHSTNRSVSATEGIPSRYLPSSLLSVFVPAR